MNEDTARFKCVKKGCNFDGVKGEAIYHVVKEHAPIHTVPFYCSLCGYRCFRLRQLQTHVQKWKFHQRLSSGSHEDDVKSLCISSTPYQVTWGPVYDGKVDLIIYQPTVKNIGLTSSTTYSQPQQPIRQNRFHDNPATTSAFQPSFSSSSSGKVHIQGVIAQAQHALDSLAPATGAVVPWTTGMTGQQHSIHPPPMQPSVQPTGVVSYANPYLQSVSTAGFYPSQQFLQPGVMATTGLGTQGIHTYSNSNLLGKAAVNDQFTQRQTGLGGSGQLSPKSGTSQRYSRITNQTQDYQSHDSSKRTSSSKSHDHVTANKQERSYDRSRGDGKDRKNYSEERTDQLSKERRENHHSTRDQKNYLDEKKDYRISDERDNYHDARDRRNYSVEIKQERREDRWDDYQDTRDRRSYSKELKDQRNTDRRDDYYDDGDIKRNIRKVDHKDTKNHCQYDNVNDYRDLSIGDHMDNKNVSRYENRDMVSDSRDFRKEDHMDNKDGSRHVERYDIRKMDARRDDRQIERYDVRKQADRRDDRQIERNDIRKFDDRKDDRQIERYDIRKLDDRRDDRQVERYDIRKPDDRRNERQIERYDIRKHDDRLDDRQIERYDIRKHDDRRDDRQIDRKNTQQQGRHSDPADRRRVNQLDERDRRDDRKETAWREDHWKSGNDSLKSKGDNRDRIQDDSRKASRQDYDNNDKRRREDDRSRDKNYIDNKSSRDKRHTNSPERKKLKTKDSGKVSQKSHRDDEDSGLDTDFNEYYDDLEEEIPQWLRCTPSDAQFNRDRLMFKDTTLIYACIGGRDLHVGLDCDEFHLVPGAILSQLTNEACQRASEIPGHKTVYFITDCMELGVYQ
ncbi:zinc finger CCCH domain-containing protein 13-like isoform X2 [Mytilus californianus]|uniref:zinc finger CCCH domain-containing protein 13-like isoform X2 n=1 Tax=Mytilus californianus TaxID=6549 RepID=UPI002245E4FD|nr:zinc finger CCCH domain-containing protein 13-like isoform X2 [Mytilus californianus]